MAASVEAFKSLSLKYINARIRIATNNLLKMKRCYSDFRKRPFIFYKIPLEMKLVFFCFLFLFYLFISYGLNVNVLYENPLVFWWLQKAFIDLIIYLNGKL